MLAFEVTPEGGVRIAGSEGDLRTLREWLDLAIACGRVEPSYVADRGLTSVVIEVDQRAASER